MTNYIAFVPKGKFQKPRIQFMSEGQEKAFWPYYDFALETLMPRIARGKISVVAFWAEDPQAAIARVADDFKIRLRPIEVKAIFLDDEIYDALVGSVDDRDTYEEDADCQEHDHKNNTDMIRDFPYTNEEIFGAK